MKATYRKQQGIALLVALLVVALATIIIAGLLDRGELNLARARNALRAQQADAYAKGLEAYAARVLARDRVEDAEMDTNADIWAVPLPPLPVPGGTLSATMHDLNGCFNLNNLVMNGAHQVTWIGQFQRLLTALKLDPHIANAVVDWLDADSEVGIGGAEDAAYLAEPLPYRAANRGFSHLSELRLLKGVSGEVYARLAPHVCALPPGTLINLNTASVPVWMSLASNMTEQLATRLWNEGHAHYAGLSLVSDQLRQQQVQIEFPSHFSVQSTYFLAQGEVNLDGLPFTFYSVIERSRSGIRVLARSRGGD